MKLLFLVLVCFIGFWCGSFAARVYLQWRAERKVKKAMKNAVKAACKMMSISPRDVDWKTGVIKVKKEDVKDVKEESK